MFPKTTKIIKTFQKKWHLTPTPKLHNVLIGRIKALKNKSITKQPENLEYIQLEHHQKHKTKNKIKPKWKRKGKTKIKETHKKLRTNHNPKN